MDEALSVLLVRHLAALKAGQEVTLKVLASIAAGLSGRDPQKIHAEILSEYQAALPTNEEAARRLFREICGREAPPPPPGKN